MSDEDVTAKRTWPEPIRSYKIEDGVTQSMLLAFMSCRQLSKYNLEHWEREKESGDALIRGDIIHTILDYHYTKNWSVGQTLKMFQQRPNFNEKVEAMMNIIQPLMETYFPYWQRLEKSYKYIECEKVFDVKFNGVRLRGKRDAVVLVTSKSGQQSRWLFETKTKAQIEEESIQDQLGFDFQTLFYILAYKLETGFDLSGVIYNIIRWPQHKSIENFEKALKEDETHFFKRYPCTYTKRGKQTFETDLTVILNEFVRHVNTIQGTNKVFLMAGNTLPTYKNTSHCMSKFGTCPFLKACATGTMAGYTQTREHFKELTENESKSPTQSIEPKRRIDKKDNAALLKSIEAYKAKKGR